MADEAILRLETRQPISFNKASATAFEKGAFVDLNDDLTAVAATADGHVGGIVAVEEVANQHSTVAVYREGFFYGTASAAITIGQTLALTGSGNKLKPSTASDVASKTVGIALEAASGDGEQFLFELKPGVGVNAFA